MRGLLIIKFISSIAWEQVAIMFPMLIFDRINAS